MQVYAGQANVLGFSVLNSSGVPIVAGTVNAYLYCKTGTNANKWYRGSDQTWQAAESIAGAATVRGTMGLWTLSLPSAAWELQAQYESYAYESGTPSVPVPQSILCVPKSVNISTETTRIGVS